MIKSNWIVLFILISLVSSCSSDDNGGGVNDGLMGEANEINDFVWKGLNDWYFWQEDVPSLADNKFPNRQDYINFLDNKTPEDLFYSILYQYGRVDRFSWIVDDVDELLQNFSGISKSSGMDLSLAYLDRDQGTILGLVNYVVPGSPAYIQGVHRGDIIGAVNGVQLNENNYTELFTDNFTAVIGKEPNIVNNQIVTSSNVEVSIQAVEINENPVYFSHIYDIANKKIAYLVLNSYKSVYNDELNAAFAAFKAAGATDLVLDLRYNGGGSLNTAVGLAQMITGQHKGQTFVTLEFNSKHDNYNEAYELSTSLPLYDFVNGQTQNIGEEIIHSLNLNQVYVLTSNGTASASELTMVGLAPYINVTQIGGKTYGKFVGSTTLYDSPSKQYLSYDDRNPKHDYAMQPIIFAYYNANHQTFYSGLEPAYPLEFSDYIGMREFGDTSDPAWAKALELITGIVYRKAQSQKLDAATTFIGTSQSLKRFGTELYIEPSELNLKN